MKSTAASCGRKGKAGGRGGEFDRLAGLLNSAIDGLKENLRNGEHVKIMLHLAEGPRTIPSAGGLMRLTSAMYRMT